MGCTVSQNDHEWFHKRAIWRVMKSLILGKWIRITFKSVEWRNIVGAYTYLRHSSGQTLGIFKAKLRQNWEIGEYRWGIFGDLGNSRTTFDKNFAGRSFFSKTTPTIFLKLSMWLFLIVLHHLCKFQPILWSVFLLWP